MSHVLFVCIQNAGRSQIACRRCSSRLRSAARARSAGSRPAAAVHPEVVEVMAEAGIDLSGKVPQELDMDDMRWADLVVTMGCGDECPYVPGKRYIDWELPDPAGQPPAAVRLIRDEISVRVQRLVAELRNRA